MKAPFSYFIIISFILTAGVLVNFFYWQIAILGVIWGFLYLLYHGYLLGTIILPKITFPWHLFYGTLFLLSLISLGGAVIYYFWQLNNIVIFVLTVFIPALIFLFLNRPEKFIAHHYSGKVKKLLYSKLINISTKDKTESKKLFALSAGTKSVSNDKTGYISNPLKRYAGKKTLLLTALYLIILSLSSKILISSATAESIRSPWEVVPTNFFLLYFLATLLLIIITATAAKRFYFILIIFHIFLSVTVALIVYSLGFGFDPFIHQATEKVIATSGLILPKPLYYLGQYSLVVYLGKIFSLDTRLIDKLLLPVLAALCVPSTIYFVFKHRVNNQKFLSLLALSFLILPFNFLIATTPQGLANLFTIITLLLTFYYFIQKNIPLYVLISLMLTTLIIHPLAGVPLIIFFLLLLLQKIKTQKIRHILTSAFSLAASFALPGIFLLQAKITDNLGTYLSSPKWTEINWRIPVLARKFYTWLDFAYTYKFNRIWLFLALAVLGSYFYYKKYGKKNGVIFIYWLSFIIILLNYLFLKLFVNFQGLIYYEQAEFAERLLGLSWYFLLPLFLYAVYIIIIKIQKSSFLIKVFFVLLFAALVTSSLYLSYPRRDDYEPARGFNVSASDLAAVHFIEDNADEPYLVLANQMVSATALREFGFARYFKTVQGKLFYYPIPTSSKLYKSYLRMVYKKASRKTISEAMNLAGVNTGYFVINDYWWRSPIIIEEAKASADEWIKIDEGKVWVFKYVK